MANLNVRNLPDEVHRAIRIQAAQHGRSTEAEIRSILERAAKPNARVLDWIDAQALETLSTCPR